MLRGNGFISLTVVYLLCSNYVVKKGHEQVEKTLEMKKWSRNGKVIKQGRNVYDVLAINVIHAQCVYILYDTISRGVWPHRGPCLLHCFSVSAS